MGNDWGKNRINQLFSGTKGGKYDRAYNSGIEYHKVSTKLLAPAPNERGDFLGAIIQGVKQMLGQRIYKGPNL